MKIVCISDTHGFHSQLQNLEGELLIHAGDISKRGGKAEIKAFIAWFEQLNFKHKVFIGGNHDFFLEEASEYEIQEMIPDSVIYLNDSGTKINGLNLWGSPISPWFHDWAFNRKRGAEIKQHWDLIPNNTNILITHGPPYGILDKTTSYLNVGCEELLEKILTIKPKVHVFGHIHENYGQRIKNDIQFINASVLNEKYHLVNDPISLSL